MHSAATSTSAKGTLHFSRLGLTFCSTQMAVAAIRGALVLAGLSAMSLFGARLAQAQTETVIYNFCPDGQGYSCPSGAVPEGGLARRHGKLYGTTHNGGAAGAGTVFELSPNGRGGWNESLLHSFTGGADGESPFGNVIFDRQGNLYGTAAYGGANKYGVVFELSPVGSSWTETVLYNFTNGVDGAYPVGGLLMDPAGNLYGTTVNGGFGAFVFELTPSGGNWTERVIYGPVDYGYTGLTRDTAGNIFGVSTETKGQNNVYINKAFELSPNGEGGWKSKVIYAFRHDVFANGTPVLDKAGNLYGTTFNDGANGLGTVYKLSPGRKGWRKKTLYSFRGYLQNDGANPGGGIVFDAAGNIYGATANGGANGDGGYGTVYELVPPVGPGHYQEKVLWSFNGTDGSEPGDRLILDNTGKLYGTTSSGGGSGCSSPVGCGLVFEVTP